MDAEPGIGVKAYKLQVKTSDPNASGTYDTVRYDNDSDLRDVTVSWVSTSKYQSARVAYAHLVVQAFKR